MIKHHFLNGVYLREATIKAGTRIRIHRHKTEHMSLLVKGSVLIEVDGQNSELSAPAFLLVPAGQMHRVTAKTDVLWYCTHITDESDESTIDEVLIEGERDAVRR